MTARAPYAASDAELLAACDVSSTLSHGPGGQHRNKTESAVRLRHKASGLTAQCEAHREKARNRDEAVRRLRLRLAIATRGVSDPAWLAPYRKGRQLAIGANGNDFVLVVACALDALAAAKGGMAAAAESLGISSTQLGKLLAADKEVLQAANRIRSEHGLGAVHG